MSTDPTLCVMRMRALINKRSNAYLSKYPSGTNDSLLAVLGCLDLIQVHLVLSNVAMARAAFLNFVFKPHLLMRKVDDEDPKIARDLRTEAAQLWKELGDSLV